MLERCRTKKRDRRPPDFDFGLLSKENKKPSRGPRSSDSLGVRGDLGLLTGQSIRVHVFGRLFVRVREQAKVFDGGPSHYDQRSNHADEEQNFHDGDNNFDEGIHSTIVRGPS